MPDLTDLVFGSFVAIASALFVTELTDKDALLLLTLAGKGKASIVFLAGATAFTLTTSLFVTVGSLINTIVPILWVKLAGGAIMIVYALWQARGLVGQEMVAKEERIVERRTSGVRFFLGMVAALALLDVAGDATEVLTFVLVAQYSNALLVFGGACTGLIVATGVETLLGSRLGRMLTPGRMRYISMVVFLLLGSFIILSSLV